MRQTSRILGAIAALTVSAPALAGVLELSDVSSGSTPASELSATLEFTLAGSMLTVTATNDSTFDIVGIYFNGDDSFDLSPTSANITGDQMTGWEYLTSVSANGFGTFDFALETGINMGMSLLPAGGMAVFTFDVINGSAGMNDFVSNKSTIPPGDEPAKAAMKFQSGGSSGQDSEWGACIECDGDDTTTMIPLPSAAGMGVLGLGGLALSRRRRD